MSKKGKKALKEVIEEAEEEGVEVEVVTEEPAPKPVQEFEAPRKRN
tara:strand:+ start:44 stop:181 length:138 start_codon:yes stop_codon:yes gene_type:complete